MEKSYNENRMSLYLKKSFIQELAEEARRDDRSSISDMVRVLVKEALAARRKARE